MNQFEKTLEALNLYKKETERLVHLKEENKKEQIRLKQEFEIWKTEFIESEEKNPRLISKANKTLENKKFKIEKELKDKKAEHISQEFMDYIEQAQKEVNEELKKNEKMYKQLRNHTYDVLKQKEQELNETLTKYDKQVQDQEKKVQDAIKLLEANKLEIKMQELEEFMLKFLNKKTGKTFFKMYDETIYQYDCYSYSERSEWKQNYYFYGLKCTNKNFTTFEELTEGIKNKEVVLFSINEESSLYKLKHNLFSLDANKFFKELSKYTYNNCKLKTAPHLSLLEDENSKTSYFKIYPNLNQKLIDFAHNIYIKQEKQIVQVAQNAVKNLKAEIDTNEQQMNKEIDKIKINYQNKLKQDKIDYYNALKDYKAKNEKLSYYLKQDNADVKEKNS